MENAHESTTASVYSPIVVEIGMHWTRPFHLGCECEVCMHLMIAAVAHDQRPTILSVNSFFIRMDQSAVLLTVGFP